MTVKITKDYAPVVSSGARPGVKMSKCIGVTIHNTDNSGVGADAKAHANLLKNSWKNKQQSWHFAVDEDGAYQSIPTDEICMARWRRWQRQGKHADRCHRNLHEL